jgi:multidrug efflux pump subunit AcrB
LSGFSVRKPYTVFVAVVIVLMLGIISFMNMTTDLLPNIDLPYIVVYTSSSSLIISAICMLVVLLSSFSIV